jgi:hypothetical protein
LRRTINTSEHRDAWLKHAHAEGTLWLAHIDSKCDVITKAQQDRRGWMFEQGELLFNVFSYLNWLAHVDLREPRHVSEKRMVSWIQTVTTWPSEVAEAFWYCLRNPLMHTGRTSIFTDHDRKSTSRLKLFADLHPNLEFDPLKFQPPEFKPSESEDGAMAIIWPSDPTHLQVNFYFPGVRRKLESALKSVMDRIGVADDASITKLSKVNMNLLPFRVVAIE